MSTFSEQDGAFELRFQHEVLRVEAWGRNAVRVRVAQHKVVDYDYTALDKRPDCLDVSVDFVDGVATLVNGDLSVQAWVTRDDGQPTTLVRFVRSSSGEEILAEKREHFWWPGAHVFYGNGTGSFEIHQSFQAYPGEKIFGLGQRTHGRLNQKGLCLDLMQRNGEVNIPFMLSDRGYGFLWNNPAVGRVEFGDEWTRWSADQSRQIDYWLTVGDSPASIIENYSGVVGRAPVLPDWASGFWQCKLRYMSQDEILNVAREYRRRGLPLSVIVTDFFHWTAMGDYRFDPEEYPDPDAMLKELDELGVKLMVSIWPTISPLSENWEELSSRGLMVGVDQGVPYHQWIHDKGMTKALPVAFWDTSNPEARDFIWGRCKENYFDKGVRVWWLDACEPELNPAHPKNLSLYSGPGAEVINAYPRDNARAFYEGSVAAGDPETVLLCRSAWAGQAKYSAAVWSGDIMPTWESLATQVRAGLNIGIAGIPWWTTDIGGFHGGDPDSEEYRELIIRWFQYGQFCPLFRLHGHREPRGHLGTPVSGGPNEVWSYGDKAYSIITEVMASRERLRPYLHEQMVAAHESGMPPMRPLFVDFSEDPNSWDIDDEFMFGPELLVAPILSPGAISRSVYLPAGASWVEVHSNLSFQGGHTVDVDAPLEYIPVFVRDGKELPVVG